MTENKLVGRERFWMCSQEAEPLLMKLTGHGPWRVFAVLSRMSDSDGVAFPSYARLAKLTGISEDSVRRALNQLKEVGIIAVQSRKRPDGGRASNIYSLQTLPGASGVSRRDAKTPPQEQGSPTLIEPENPSLTDKGQNYTHSNYTQKNKKDPPSRLGLTDGVRVGRGCWLSRQLKAVLFDPKRDPVALPHASEAFIGKLLEWADYRTVDRRKPLTPVSLSKQLRKMGEWTEGEAIESMERSMSASWLDVFPPRRSKPRDAPGRSATTYGGGEEVT